MIQRIRSTYASCGSLTATASTLHLSIQTVRKVLISEGDYTTPTISQAIAMHDAGCSIEEIGQQLGLKSSAVQSMLPYSKGPYVIAESTENAIRIRACRERKKAGIHCNLSDLPKSGVPGVSYRRGYKKNPWAAQHKGHYIGVYPTVEAAAAALNSYKRNKKIDS